MLRKKSIISMVAALFLAAGFMAGCSDDDDNNGGNNITGGGEKNGKTVAQLIKDDDDLTIFSEAVERAGLMGRLQNKDQTTTVFAPTNEAFALFANRISEEEFEELMNDSAKLRDLLLYHMAYGRLELNNIENRNSIETLLNGKQITVDKVAAAPEEDDDDEAPAEVVRLNYSPARIVESDINAENGVIQKINRVLEIPENGNGE